jgi:ribosomal protein S18 acetylase RimI-like enzyme
LTGQRRAGTISLGSIQGLDRGKNELGDLFSAPFRLAAPMGLTYFKRFRMEIDLRGRDLTPPFLPPGYRLVPWDKDLVEAHAETKYLSFRSEIDAQVFPCLGDYEGCLRLMREIVRKEGFLPEATWLVGYQASAVSRLEYCGTIQGVRDKPGLGAVQNLGVTPEHRGRRLGTLLLLRTLDGFRSAGLRRGMLEVTCQNEGAIRLYRRLGFYKAKTVYKAAEVAYS